MSENNKLSVPNIDLSVFKTAGTLSEEDKKKVREYSKLTKAREQLIQQHRKLDEMIALVGEKWCKGYLWTNKNGDVIPVFDLEDDYLKNIVNWCTKNSRKVPKEIKKEYYARFGYSDLGKNDDAKYEPSKAKSRSHRWTDPFDVDEDWD